MTGTGVKTSVLTNAQTQSFQVFGGMVKNLMPNPDTLIKTKGINFDIFREMLLDGTISGKIEQIEGIIKSKKLIIKGENADLVWEALNNVNIDRLIGEMFQSFIYGYSVQETIWKDTDTTGGKWLVDRIEGRRQERFGFAYDGTLKYRDGSTLKDITDNYKYIVTRHGYANENHYGSPVLSKCYWSWMFKKAGFRFWVTAAEKFGVPTVLALFDTNGLSDDEAQKRAQTLAESLSQIQNDAALAVANVTDIKTLEASGNAQGMFEAFVNVCNSEIGKAISGETMTSENGGGSGSFALSNVHADTLYSKAQSIANEIAKTIEDTIAVWAVVLNKGADAELCSVELVDVPQASFTDVLSAVDRNIPVSLKSIYDDYGVPRPSEDDKDDAFVKPATSTGGMYGFSDIPEGEQSRFFQTRQKVLQRRLIR